MIKRHPEPLLWLLFSAGGVVSALLMPILLLLFGLAFPLGWLAPPSYEHLLAVLGHPLTRLVLFGLCVAVAVPLGASLPLHAVRRAADQAPERGDRAVCYGGAIAGSVMAAYLLWNVPAV